MTCWFFSLQLPILTQLSSCQIHVVYSRSAKYCATHFNVSQEYNLVRTAQTWRPLSDLTKLQTGSQGSVSSLCHHLPAFALSSPPLTKRASVRVPHCCLVSSALVQLCSSCEKVLKVQGMWPVTFLTSQYQCRIVKIFLFLCYFGHINGARGVPFRDLHSSYHFQ